MKYKSKNTLKTIYGGVLQDPNNARTNFFNFLKNSSVTLLTNSSNYGTIIKVDIINPDYISPYTMFRTKHFGEQIKCLIVKICPLVKKYERHRPILLISGKEKKTTPIDNFFEEYYAQIFIALDTCKYLETICPFPVYIDLFKKTSIQEDIYFNDLPTIDEVNIDKVGVGEDNIDNNSPTDYMFNDKECLDIFKQKFDIVIKKDEDEDEDEDEYGDVGEYGDVDKYGDVGDVIKHNFGFVGGTKTIIDELITNLEQKYDYLGIMSMEIADGYNTLKTFKLDPEIYKTYENMARYEIISLALEQKLLHGDFHNENILINPNYEGYFYEMLGKALLIDFGIVKYLKDTDHDQLKELISQNNYTAAIDKIYYLSIPEPLWEYPGYTWFRHVDSRDNAKLISLHQQRQQSKVQLEEFSKNIRKTDPTTKYPKIPLSLRDYNDYLPKMSYGLFFKEDAELIGGFNDMFFNTIVDQPISMLLQNILNTISFGINSYFNISKKIKYIKSEDIEIKGIKSEDIESKGIKTQSNLKPMQFDKKPMQFDKKPMQFDKKPMQFDKKPIQFDKIPIYKNTSVAAGGKLILHTYKHKKNKKNKKNNKKKTHKRRYRKNNK